MHDHDIERALRTTFTDRAATVSDGPAWAGTTDDLARHGTDRRRTRWLAPLAAAVVVAAVAGGVIAYRHTGGDTNAAPVAADQLPIPAGMQAVDALGVEIFVPASFSVDDPCAAQGVIRPVAFSSVPTCLPRGLNHMSVTVSTIPERLSQQCVEKIKLGGEAACLHDTVHLGPPSTVSYSVSWPKHRVVVSADGSDRTVLLQIMRSAHAVPVDRHGCDAVRDPIEPPGKHDPAAVGGAPAVPDNRRASSMGVCWYVTNRLVASASLDAAATAAVLRGAAAAGQLFSPVGTPACSSVDHSDAVILSVRYASGGEAEGILRLANCPGRSNGTHQQAFVTNLARLAGMPLTLGYPAPR